jgi:hypothetical protein
MAAQVARAAQLLREAEFVQLAASPDADSVAGMALLARALLHAGVPFQARFVREEDLDLPSLARDAQAQLVLVGLAGGRGEALDALPGEPVVLDATEPALAGKRALLLHDATSAAALALPLARALHPAAEPLLALAGLEAAKVGERGEPLRPPGSPEGPVPALGPGPLVEALAGCTDPYLPGLSGRARAAKQFLERLGLPAAQPAEELDAGQSGALASALALHLLAKGAGPAAARALARPDALGPVPGGGARGLARLLGALCAARRPAVALALAMGDARGEPEARAAAAERGERLLQALLKLEGEGAGKLLRSDAELAEELAWSAACALAGGAAAAVAVQGDRARLTVAAPQAEPAHLGKLAAEVAAAGGGRGGARGPLATLVLPAAAAERAAEQVLRGLGP